MAGAQTIAIHPAVGSDAAAMALIHEQSATVAYRHIFPPDAPFPAAETRDLWAQHLASPGAFALLAEDSGLAVGFIAAGPQTEGGAVAGSGEIHGLHIRPTHWRRGIGRRLVEDALARLRADGFRACVVWVLRENRRGRDFYERTGWRPDGVERIEELATPVVVRRYQRVL